MTKTVHKTLVGDGRGKGVWGQWGKGVVEVKWVVRFKGVVGSRRWWGSKG